MAEDITDQGPEAPSASADAARAAALEVDLADARDRLLRAAAEMENLRRRTEREMADARQYAVTTFARDVLPVVDNLRRALDSAGHLAEGKATTFVEGVEMTERELLRVLEKNGVRRIDAVGQKFDPHRHQAMLEVETTAVPPGTVAEVAQPGYAIGDRILRPALVAVAKSGRQPASPRPAEAVTIDGEAGPAEASSP